ncbi:hypothetical protein AX16_005526 [Volvariella volvacea WC 439]|nr:hypothetical protein AX16_005526 [Volvariella volvacea WC 439]
MSSQEIQTLLASPSTSEADAGALTYLNAVFKSLDDLSTLELAINKAQHHNDELQHKAASSQLEVDKLIGETRTTTATYLHTAQELSLLRHSLADELAGLNDVFISPLSDEETQPTLLEDIETLHRNLKELESVKGYLQIIERTLRLSEAAIQQFRSSTVISVATLQGYQSLQDFVLKVSKACSTVGDGAGQQELHLVKFLQRILDKTWINIKGVLSSALLTASEKLGWPMAVDYASAKPPDRNTFEKAFLDLLTLQSLGSKIGVTQSISEKPGLYPLQTLVQAVSMRFKYHFEGDRNTNRIDKPEWYFTNILNVIHEQKNFMDSIIQVFISSTEYRAINAWREFTYLSLPLLVRKLKNTIPKILSHPSLLAHTVYQALSFDAAVIEEGFVIQGTSAITDATKDSGSDTWPGISETILGHKPWFDAWVAGERKFAEDQYHEAISSTDAWSIVDDSSENQPHNLKTTNSARRLKALVEQVTDRYSPLPRLDQRIEFLTVVQLPLLDAYRGRIAASLDAFETLSSSLVRAVPGALPIALGGGDDTTVKVDTGRLTSGVEGVQRLCKALVSAKFVSEAMGEWGEDLLFLELWTEVNRTDLFRKKIEGNALVPALTRSSETPPSDMLFDSLLAQYQQLIRRSEEIIVHQVCAELEGVIKAHLNAAMRDTDHEDTAVSQTLLIPVALLSTHLTYLRSTLLENIVTNMYRRIASRLSDHLLQRQILYRGQFSAQEGQTTLAECRLWIETCVGALGGGFTGGRNRIEAPWRRFLQAASLVSAEGETWTSIVDGTFGPQSDKEWESLMTEVSGFSEIPRMEVGQILRRRVDCQQ